MVSRDDIWSKEEFEKKLRDKEDFYHIHHPLHQLMETGKLTRAQVQGWVANRFYYQCAIPKKDAAILANCDDLYVRRQWLQRLVDHDGCNDIDGGIEAWLQLGEAVGLDREDLLHHRFVLPGVRFAVDAYENFARRACWQEAAGSSLTELFAGKFHQARLENWPHMYPWIDHKGYRYFRKRLQEARRDVTFGLKITLEYCNTLEKQQRAVELLQFKLDILWAMCDAMWLAYIEQRPPYCKKLRIERDEQ